MTENEVKLSKSDAQKERIRQRYKGINPDELDVIPALPPQTLDRDGQEQRVAVYARVSTDDPRQTSSVIVNKKVPKMSEKIPHLFYRERHPYRCHIPFYYVFS